MFLTFSLLINTNNVSGGETEVMSVTEGETVTLPTEVENQKDRLIVWYFGPDKILLAQINGKAGSTWTKDRDVKLDNHTGSLTIPNVTANHSGLYNLKITTSNRPLYKKFIVKVYAQLLNPEITCEISKKNSEGSSVSRCNLLCSVVHVRDVSLSWYKENSLISSISVSDLSNSLSLEVDYEDKNAYSCVINNTISNKTKQFNTDEHCPICTVSCFRWIYLLMLPFVAFICIIFTVVICFCKNKAGFQKVNLEAGHAEKKSALTTTDQV